MRKILFGVIAASMAAIVSMGFAAVLQGSGDTWSIQYDEPSRNGKFTTTIDVSWTNAKGKKEEETITAEAEIERDPNDPMDADEKRVLMEGLINDALDKKKVNGQRVATVTGTGNAVLIDPNTVTEQDDNGNTVDTGLKIDNIKHRDRTGQEDKISDPTNSSAGLALITADGSLTGKDSDNDTASTFTVTLGSLSYSRVLNGAMTKRELFYDLADQMAAEGVTLWLDVGARGEPTLYVLATGAHSGAGATTTDDGLMASISLKASY